MFAIPLDDPNQTAATAHTHHADAAAPDEHSQANPHDQTDAYHQPTSPPPHHEQPISPRPSPSSRQASVHQTSPQTAAPPQPQSPHYATPTTTPAANTHTTPKTSAPHPAGSSLPPDNPQTAPRDTPYSSTKSAYSPPNHQQEVSPTQTHHDQTPPHPHHKPPNHETHKHLKPEDLSPAPPQ